MSQRWLVTIVFTLLVGCTGVPDGVTPVDDFQLSRYLGTWYEIARLDHRFERGLTGVTAEYSVRDDGGVRVLNRGYSKADKQWEAAEGKAYFVDEPTQGHLKVSFFGPFYGSYIVAELDRENYQYALVTGPNRNYLWILAREPELDNETLSRLVNKADALGFATDKLIFVDQTINKNQKSGR